MRFYSFRWLLLALVLLVQGCSTSSGNGSDPNCGNGEVDPGETCDPGIVSGSGACPQTCDDGNGCTADQVTGSAEQCSAACSFLSITECQAGDDCCPAGCTHASDGDCSALCGDGVVDPGETCDGNCPTECNDGSACTTDTLIGSVQGCSAACSYAPISACSSGDGCCPAGCDANSDSDCSATCGNGVVESGETCDGDCPTDCSDGNACTQDNLTGSAQTCSAACSYQPINQCQSGDGCCPAGCNSVTDNDCSASCGNGIVETGETCDGNCPADCNDGNACTLDNLTGSAGNCNVACSYQPVSQCVDGDGCCPTGCSTVTDNDCSASCGNGVVETGETCDGNCPADCNDGNACTLDNLTGSAGNCNVACSYQPVSQCVDGDGCCPSGCNSNTDDDCSASCGNGVVETGETCDGNCPADCNDGNACTLDNLTGSAGNCNVACSYQPVSQCQHSDGCCPTGCSAVTDNDCSASCGNGVVETGETCDGNCPADCNDGNACTLDNLTGSAGNCNVACSYQPVSQCVDGDGCCPSGCNSNTDDDCSASCGNGVVETGETCDGNCPADCNDGNACTLDNLTGSAGNCNVACSYQPVSQCQHSDGCCPTGCNTVTDNDCSATCGNGVVETGETCDGNCPADCNDGNSCTLDNLTGSAGNCNVACSYQPISQCQHGDGCCPSGCNVGTDDDCTAYTWLPAELVEFGSSNALTPEIGMDSAGNAMAVWKQGSTNQASIWANRYEVGVGWGTPERIENDSHNAMNPYVSVNELGDAAAVWEQTDGSRYNIWANNYDSGLGLWQTATLLETENGGSGYEPRTAVDPSGDAMAIWTQDHGDFSIWASRYQVGTGWEAPVVLESSIFSGYHPEVAFDPSGNALAVWHQQMSGYYDIYATRFEPGTGWASPELLETTGGGNAYYPELAIDGNGHALVVWEQYDGSRWNGWSGRYEAGTGWQSRTALETAAGNANHPRVSLNTAGNGMAIWDQYDGLVWNIVASPYSVATGWGTPTIVDVGSDNAGDPRVGVDASGNAVAVWTQTDGSIYSVWASQYQVGTGWSTPVLLETDDTYEVYRLRLAVDPQGRALAVWDFYNGSHWDVWSARLQ